MASLISLSHVISASTKDTARKVVDALLKKLEEPMRSAVTGALDRSRRPRHSGIDWSRTIRKPRNTILVLISDLYEGGVEASLLRRAAALPSWWPRVCSSSPCWR